MPRVASEAHSIPPSRPHPASARNPEADAKPAASPFAEMLDSAAEPASRRARTERPERADRPDKPASAQTIEHRPSDAKPARDSAGIEGNTVSIDDAKTAKASKDGEATDGKADAAKAPADIDGKPEPDLVLTAALDTKMAVAADPAATVTAPPIDAVTPVLPLPAVPTDAGTPEAGASAALPAAEVLRVSSDAARNPEKDQRITPQAKPVQDQTQTPNDKTIGEADDAPIKGPAPAESQIESANDSKSRGDKAAAELHRAFADLTAKLGAVETPVARNGDAAGPADAGQNAGVLTQAGAQAGAPNAPVIATTPAAAHAQSPAVAVPLAGLAVEIATQAHAGKNHFDIRLDPPEFGRIDVKLDVDRDGNVSTRLVVDRSDTLDLLKRDASSLERALQQAGLKTSEHGLDFSLRQHAFAEHDAAAQTGARLVVPDDDTAPLEALRQGYGRLLGLGGGLDIRV